MKKIFKLEELDCAHCANKIEDAISKIEGITSSNVIFLTGKLTIEIDDSKEMSIIKKMKKIVKKIDSDVEVIEQ